MPTNKEKATELAHLFGGNGLSTDQQIELVAAKLEEWAKPGEQLAWFHPVTRRICYVDEHRKAQREGYSEAVYRTAKGSNE